MGRIYYVDGGDFTTIEGRLYYARGESFSWGRLYHVTPKPMSKCKEWCMKLVSVKNGG